MEKLRQLLEGKLQTGVYLLQIGLDWHVIADEAKLAGYNFYYIDGTGIIDEKDFFVETQRVLGFPHYFGHNWDAFDDCITDLSWAPTARGNIIFYDSFENFAKSNPEQFKLAYYGLDYGTRRDTVSLPCYILFRGDESLLPEQPKRLTV